MANASAKRIGFQLSKRAIAMYTLSLTLSHFLYQHLKKIGTPRRDSTGNLTSPGSDLNQPGMTEWMFDVLYISWFAQIGSAILGEWFWWIYTMIPAFVVYKLWNTVISPMILGRSSSVAEEDRSKRV
ncbi:hypothetical protein B0F90DRAFT_1665592 [Multifurca ochricompacta]|uniref:DUF788-domain-containing protein n=1 Tax=Multifurca ochricompacta TaxID=376703 RepID=A0AAD4QPY4_9AGAM|nr:hypothetical protein B0F90DRAFT_1665592 [Multifurca ochricompacta]